MFLQEPNKTTKSILIYSVFLPRFDAETSKSVTAIPFQSTTGRTVYRILHNALLYFPAPTVCVCVFDRVERGGRREKGVKARKHGMFYALMRPV